MNDDPNPANGRKPFLRRHAATIKMVSVVLLVLLLLIPLAMIGSVLRERMHRRDAAVAEISASWGTEQTIVGPVLVIPYSYKTKVWKERTVDGRQERYEAEETRESRVHFLPEEFTLEGTVSPRKLSRGIYEAVVYDADLALSGRFAAPDFAKLGVEDTSVHWGRAVVSIGVSDLRGTSSTLSMSIGGQTVELLPGSVLRGFPSGVTATVADARALAGNPDFSLRLDLKGSRGIRVAPVGKQNNVHVISSWPDPSFRGAFLPAQREVSEQGFAARWEVSWYGRGYPQVMTDRGEEVGFNAESVARSLFGVDFMSLVDSYRMVERATKYGVLFIALVFTAFFLFEALQSLRIHSIQYTLVGAALCLFYLAVLSLSEFWPFGYAYWTGAAASSLLIVAYCLSVLKSGLRTTAIAVALAVIYSYLYVVLQLQDYSLLLGTLCLFVVLGIVMFATRKLDWSAWE